MNLGAIFLFLSGVLGKVELTEIQLVDGTLRGAIIRKPDLRNNSVNEFLGIPFAEPPIGLNRFEPPRPVKPWAGVKEALVYKPSCIQSKNLFVDTSKVSEDCLYLNLWIPANSTQTLFPVMIFFYGGSWETGSAMFPLYDGEPAAALQESTIIITANYRLNVFGFLGANDLRGADNSTGNYGLQDQREVMNFVIRNAEGLRADTKKNYYLRPERRSGLGGMPLSKSTKRRPIHSRHHAIRTSRGLDFSEPLVRHDKGNPICEEAQLLDGDLAQNLLAEQKCRGPLSRERATSRRQLYFVGPCCGRHRAP